MGAIWRGSVLSALRAPLEKVSSDMAKDNAAGYLPHVPDLFEGFIKIRESRKQIQGDDCSSSVADKTCPETKRNLERRGQPPPYMVVGPLRRVYY